MEEEAVFVRSIGYLGADFAFQARDALTDGGDVSLHVSLQRSKGRFLLFSGDLYLIGQLLTLILEHLLKGLELVHDLLALVYRLDLHLGVLDSRALLYHLQN